MMCEGQHLKQMYVFKLNFSSSGNCLDCSLGKQNLVKLCCFDTLPENQLWCFCSEYVFGRIGTGQDSYNKYS